MTRFQVEAGIARTKQPITGPKEVIANLSIPKKLHNRKLVNVKL